MTNPQNRKNNSKSIFSKLEENSLREEFYAFILFKKIYWPLIIVFFVSFGLLFNLSLKHYFESYIARVIKESSPCPISYKELKSSLFFIPKITFTDLKLAPSCLGSQSDFIFPSLDLKFAGFGLYPLLGLKLNIDLIFDQSTADVDLLLSFNEVMVKIEKSHLLANNIIRKFPSIPKMKGEIELKLLTRHELKTNNIREINLLLQSKNFELLTQNIQGLTLPSLYIGPFNLKITQKNGMQSEKTGADTAKPAAAAAATPKNSLSFFNKEKVKKGEESDEKKPQHQVRLNYFELSFGDLKTSSALGTVKGPLSLNSADLMSSVLNLKGEVKFSQSFAKEFQFLLTFFKKYEVVTSFVTSTSTVGTKESADQGVTYTFLVDGPLSAPLFSPVN